MALPNAALCLLEQEVNELWAGLGYYSRGKRLQEAARKVPWCWGVGASVVHVLVLAHSCPVSLGLSSAGTSLQRLGSHLPAGKGGRTHPLWLLP